MVMNKGAALLALAMAGAAYYFKNKSQVKGTVSDISNRLQRGMGNRKQLQSNQQQLQSNQQSAPAGDWSQGNIA